MPGFPDRPDGGFRDAGEVATSLAASFDAPDERAEARQLLESRILPPLLVDLHDHPAPEALLEEAFEQVKEDLEASEAEDRLEELRSAAFAGDLKSLEIASMDLAVARYASDNPAAATEATGWLSQSGRELLEAGDAEAISRAASARLDEIEAWAATAQREAPQVWERHRQGFLVARANLQSARSGRFESALGPLVDFLRSVGATVETLHIH